MTVLAIAVSVHGLVHSRPLSCGDGVFCEYDCVYDVCPGRSVNLALQVCALNHI